ncbi:AraC family transcriptional regulator [Alloalcanivorax sp. C16-1]|uniref:AraC family transcriptional regulator n=1 Tax=Alloalcanivorax sp. C16-1 TaxID=3390051 RepID=UPI003970BDFB
MSDMVRRRGKDLEELQNGTADLKSWDLSNLRVSFSTIDPDCLGRPVTSFVVERQQDDDKLPLHQHRKGQLVLTAKGSISCHTLDGLRIVPSNGAVWIPGETPHSISIPDNGKSYCVFIDPEIAPLPRSCATISISPLLQEIIYHLAKLPPLYPLDGPTSRIVQVLIDELAQMKHEPLHFPVSTHPKIRHMAFKLLDSPGDRRTLSEWACEVATSERTLARLVLKHTGMTFGAWRRQLHIVIAIQKLSAGCTVQAVASDLGYDSASAFTAMFKQHMGKPPRRYLQDLQEDYRF